MGEDAKTFRERAQHARLGAKEARTAQHREIFESLAISYESMALAAEWAENAGQPTPQLESREPRSQSSRLRVT